MFIQTRVKYVFGETRCGTPGHRDAVTRLVLQSDMFGLGHQVEPPATADLRVRQRMIITLLYFTSGRLIRQPRNSSRKGHSLESSPGRMHAHAALGLEQLLY